MPGLLRNDGFDHALEQIEAVESDANSERALADIDGVESDTGVDKTLEDVEATECETGSDESLDPGADQSQLSHNSNSGEEPVVVHKKRRHAPKLVPTSSEADANANKAESREDSAEDKTIRLRPMEVDTDFEVSDEDVSNVQEEPI